MGMAWISFFPILVDDINSHVCIQCQTYVPIISHLIFYTEKTSRVVFMFRRRECVQGVSKMEDNIWVYIILYLQPVAPLCLWRSDTTSLIMMVYQGLINKNNAEFVMWKPKIFAFQIKFKFRTGVIG